ncbi:MAG: alpha/beta hydrolase [Stenotrophobium sp.]
MNDRIRLRLTPAAPSRRDKAITFHKIFAALSGLLMLAGCSGAQIINAITPQHGYQRARDISFGDHGLKLDVYTPTAATAAPLIVFFYGGSWEASETLDKSQYKFVGQALAEQGYVVVIPEYRVYPQVKYPEFLDDSAQAVKWAHDHAAEYGADPGKLVLMGHSAGAYNAAMLALDPVYLQAAGVNRAWVRGMIGLAGPYDFLPITDPILQTIFGPADQWPLTQPIHYVDGRQPPMLLIAGDDDNIVYVKNTRNLYRRIIESGGKAKEVIYPGLGHIQIVARLSTWLPGHANLMMQITEFVDAVTAAAAPAKDLTAK